MFRLNEIRKTMQQHLQPMLSLIPEVPVKISNDKSKFITFEPKAMNLLVLASQQAAPVTKNTFRFLRRAHHNSGLS